MDEPELDGEPAARPDPAPLGPRAAAGVIDAVGVGVLVAVLFWVHLSRTGTVMPLWTICGLALAWNVLPAWGFRATLGLGLLGLRIVHHEHPDRGGGIIELAARELVGRGVLATAYLIFVLLGVVWAVFGVGGISFTAGTALLFFALAWIFFGLALAGQIMMFVRTDRRSVGDMIGKVAVVKAISVARSAAVAGGAGAEEPAEDELWAARARRNRSIAVVVMELLLIAVISGAPFVNLMHFDHSNVHDALARKEADYKIENLRRQFQSNPAGRKVAGELIDWLRYRDETEEAERVLEKHRRAREEADRAREQTLLAGLDKQRDWGTLELLLTLYDEHGRVDDAAAAWMSYLEAHDTGQDRASFGIWLYNKSRYEAAIRELRLGIEKEWDTGQSRAYIGLSLWELGKESEARDALLEAVEVEPAIEEELRGYIEQLDEKLGPRPKREPSRP